MTVGQTTGERQVEEVWLRRSGASRRFQPDCGARLLSSDGVWQAGVCKCRSTGGERSEGRSQRRAAPRPKRGSPAGSPPVAVDRRPRPNLFVELQLKDDGQTWSVSRAHRLSREGGIYQCMARLGVKEGCIALDTTAEHLDRPDSARLSSPSDRRSILLVAPGRRC